MRQQLDSPETLKSQTMGSAQLSAVGVHGQLPEWGWWQQSVNVPEVTLKAAVQDILMLRPVSTSWDRAGRLFGLASRPRAERAKNHTAKEMGAFNSFSSPPPCPVHPPLPWRTLPPWRGIFLELTFLIAIQR